MIKVEAQVVSGLKSSCASIAFDETWWYETEHKIEESPGLKFSQGRVVDPSFVVAVAAADVVIAAAVVVGCSVAAVAATVELDIVGLVPFLDTIVAVFAAERGFVGDVVGIFEKAEMMLSYEKISVKVKMQDWAQDWAQVLRIDWDVLTEDAIEDALQNGEGAFEGEIEADASFGLVAAVAVAVGSDFAGVVVVVTVVVVVVVVGEMDDVVEDELAVDAAED